MEDSTIRELGCVVSKNALLLSELLDGPKCKTTLADEIGVSKSSIYYRHDVLEEYDLVERGSEGYRLTPVGRLVTERYLGALEAMKDAFAPRVLLQEVPDDAVPPSDVLEGAETVLPEGRPERVRTDFCEWVRSANEVRGMLPYASCALVESVSEKLTDDGLALDVTMTPETMAYLREYRADEVRAIRDAESTTIREMATLPSFGLVVIDEPSREVGLIVFDDDGYVCGFLRTDSESGYRWGTGLIAKYTESQNRRSPQTRVRTD